MYVQLYQDYNFDAAAKLTSRIDRTKRVKDARSEAQKEIEDYRKEKEEEYKKYEDEVSHVIHRANVIQIDT